MALLKRTTTAMVAAVLLAVLWPWTAQAEVASEYDVKAAFLYNFTKFVDWPPSAFADERSTFKICVLGQDPFGKTLEELAKGGEAGRNLTVLRVDEMSRPAGCQILFISRSERARMPQILGQLRDAPVLTVADTDGFLDHGGIINFTLEKSKVRFEINHQAAERAGIKISSKLLRLASHVKGSPGP
jgi:hypothetical protein